MGMLDQVTKDTPTPTMTPAANPSSPGSVAQAASVNATSYTQDLNPKALAANQMKENLKTDSTLMQRAREIGNREAAKRGFEGGSSIAAGAAMGEMADRLTPLVLQDAQAEGARQSQNLTELNATGRFNAGNAQRSLEQEQNYQQDLGRIRTQGDENVKLQAEGYTQDLGRITTQGAENRSLQSEGYVQDLSRIQAQQGTNAALERVRTDGQLQLAAAQARYNNLIQTNQSAAQLYSTYQATVGDIYSNPNITPEQAAVATGKAMEALNGAMTLINAISGPETAPGAPTVATDADTGTNTSAALANFNTALAASVSQLRGTGGQGNGLPQIIDSVVAQGKLAGLSIDQIATAAASRFPGTTYTDLRSLVAGVY
jgi:hypothetical protein